MECGGVVGGSKWSARQVQCVGVHIKVSPHQVQCVGVHIKVSPLQVERQFVQKTTLPSGIPIHLSSTSTPFATLRISCSTVIPPCDASGREKWELCAALFLAY